MQRAEPQTVVVQFRQECDVKSLQMHSYVCLRCLNAKKTYEAGGRISSSGIIAGNETFSLTPPTGWWIRSSSVARESEDRRNH